ncbi:enhancer of polycomb-like-domain-containing protein [Jimgerdemannia flammicorona]|uniref:Enhancer of polycomb-like protein n=1 Tax=Jimgerdemannia flammicorona TaxID=994334 RepID=A0A433A153_9FUNG|nr:enhancer of polycomb-like-domain-containing protein [Jimgerdemannia flammicorona]
MIPVPDASRTINNYDELYRRKFSEPQGLIRFSTTVEDCTGCPYTMDEEDEQWLIKYNVHAQRRPEEKLTEDQFEQVMWQFEKATNEKVPFLNVSIENTSIPDYNVLEPTFVGNALNALKPAAQHVYSHWRQRRLKRGGKMIIPQLRFDDTLRNESDPYLCFRRRETKPLRKTRRTDAQSLDKLRRLRKEMDDARKLLEMVSRREKMRKESLLLEHLVFDQKCTVRDMQRKLGIKDDDELLAPPKKKKRIIELGSSGATIKIPLSKIKRESLDSGPNTPTSDRPDRLSLSSPTGSVLETELARRRAMEGWEDMTDYPYQPFPLSIPMQFFRHVHPTSLAASNQRPSARQPSYRRRVGRGGRAFMDRRGIRPPTLPSDHQSVSGKTKPRDYYERCWDRYKFDNDMSDDEMVIDDSKESLTRYRCTLLSEADLRNLITMPFHNPSQNLPLLNGFPPGVPRINAVVAKNMVPNTNGTNGSTPHGNNVNMNNRPTINGLPLAQPVKRQNSKTKLTPQQAAVAMANGMMAANMAAQAANSTASPTSSQNQAAVVAAVAAQQQQQQAAAGISSVNGVAANMHKKLVANVALQRAAVATVSSGLQTPQRPKPGMVNGSPNMMMTPVLAANGLNGIGIQTPNGAANQAPGGLPLKMPQRLAMMAGGGTHTPGSSSPNALAIAQAAAAATQAQSVMQSHQAVTQVLATSHSGLRGGMAVPVVNGLPVSLSQSSVVSSPSLLATPLPLSPQMNHALPQQGQQQQQLSAAMMRAPSKSPQQGINSSSPPPPSHHQQRINHVTDTRC